MRTQYHRTPLTSAALVPLAVSITGCAVIGDIFKAGVWVGVASIFLLAALVVGLLRLMSS